ncbi:putative Malectin-like domain-containing protein [Arabidopsis thaliana]
MEESSMAQASLICLLLSFSIIMLSNAADISIDCGSSSSHIDADNRTWVGDTDFVTTGLTSKFVPFSKFPAELTTLRYFPTGETNCYTNIPVDKGGKVLVRTRFLYGDYDDESTAPKFDVVYDGKHRDSVVTTTYETATQSEAIFIPENGNISVCFYRTLSSETPFVSTIEVRMLDDSMYTDLGPKEGFILQQRTAYGAQELVRFPYDPYDRIWMPASVFASHLTSSATSIDTTGADNRPPEIILRTSWSQKGMAFYDIKLPFSGMTFYIVIYFSEPLSLGSDQKRSFNVYYEDKQVGSDLIVPPFGAVTQASLRDVVKTELAYLTFEATPDSTLDPLINALELYVISNSGGSGNGTNSTSTSGGGSPSPGGGSGSPPSTGGGSGSPPSTGGGGGSPSKGGGGGKSGGSNNGDGGTNKASEDEKSAGISIVGSSLICGTFVFVYEDSSGKSGEEKSSSNLALPLGISLPTLLSLGAGGWGVWKYFIKPRRHPESECFATQTEYKFTSEYGKRNSSECWAMTTTYIYYMRIHHHSSPSNICYSFFSPDLLVVRCNLYYFSLFIVCFTYFYT